MLNERVIEAKVFGYLCVRAEGMTFCLISREILFYFCGTHIKIILLQWQWDDFSPTESKGEILLVREKQQPVPSPTEPSVPFTVSLSKSGRGVMMSTGCDSSWHVVSPDICRTSMSWVLFPHLISIDVKQSWGHTQSGLQSRILKGHRGNRL